MIFYYLIFSMLAACSFVRGRLGAQAFVFFGVVLLLVAAFRGEGVDRDYVGYLEYYEGVLKSGFENVEPSFILITRFVDLFFGSELFIFIIYALLGVLIKLYAIDKLTEQKNLSLLVYFSGFFLLFEMTQIRAGVAAGLLLLCIQPIRERRLLPFLFFGALAFCFHYSAAMIFPLYFLSSERNSLRKFGLLLPLALVLFYLNINLLSAIGFSQIELIELKLRSYEEHALLDSTNNIFNPLFLARCLVAYTLFWHATSLSEKSPYFIVLTKIYFIGIFIFIAFASVPGVSSRASEFLFSVEIILIPSLVYIVRERNIGTSVVIAASLASLSYSLLVSKLIQPYF